MKRLPATLVIVTGLFAPSLTVGEEVKMRALEKVVGLWYKKGSNIPFTGKVVGNPQGALRGGEWNGPFVSFHPNGRLKKIATCNRGKLDGEWFLYHENGQVKMKVTYKLGRPVGEQFQYHESGMLIHKGTYKDVPPVGSDEFELLYGKLEVETEVHIY